MIVVLEQWNMSGIDPDDALPLYHQIAEVIRGRIVERGDRLGIVVGSESQEKLLPLGEHRFRSDAGRIRFHVVDGAVRGLEFLSDGGRKVRARRR